MAQIFLDADVEQYLSEYDFRGTRGWTPSVVARYEAA